MTPRHDRFLFVLYLIFLIGSCHAIYDPSVTTVKPPQRREPVLPWYLSGKDYPQPSEDTETSRSPKWATDPVEPRKPAVFDSEAQTWSPWRKDPGSDIEQRTEVGSKRPALGNLDQKRDWFLEYDQFEERENQKYPRKPTNPEGFGQRKEPFKPQTESYHDIYEGLSHDTTKSHQDRISLSTKPKLTVARYDSHRGVVCPEVDSTGQFVYPQDCKFFVNCWKGRAFVQPCPPGTLFNPETLECDFPHKVKCYGGEIADFPSSDHSVSFSRNEPLISASQTQPNKGRLEASLHEPRCPPHVTGLLPHPTDCTKFLQCAHGVTYVMDCGPGTVFNPAVSVCDWPRNVRGCEGAYKTAEEQDKPLVPPDPYGHKNSEYNDGKQQKRIKCPADYTGLLPHPETCKKFLQCAHGFTYIMDCAPGTAFNPSISVCDWPYNVPGCSEDKPVSNGAFSTTTARSWASHDHTKPNPWQNIHRPDQTSHNHHGGISWPSHVPNVPETTRTPDVDWDSRLRPTWKPAWTTARPSYGWGYHNYSSHNREDSYKPTPSGNDRYPSSYDQSTRPSFAGEHPHYYQHHDHDGHGSPYHPSGSQGVGYPSSYDQQQPQRPDDSYGQGTTEERWHPHYGHPWNYPGKRPEGNENQSGHPLNHAGSGVLQGNLPANRRFGHDFTPNRQEYGRTGSGSTGRKHDPTPAPDGNIYVDSDYDSSEDTSQVPIGGVWSSATNKTVLIWPGRNRTSAGKPEAPSQGIGFGSADWNSQQGQGQEQMKPPTQPSPRPWDQGATSQDDKLHEWGSRPNFYQQSTTDSEVDRKLDEWASKTNIIQHAKGQIGSGVKATSNDNGSGGHYITREIEVNQGHSNTRNYGTTPLQQPDTSNDTSHDFRSRNDSRTHRSFNFTNGQPATHLQPPFYDSINQAYGHTINFTGTKPAELPTYHSANQPHPPPLSADLMGSDSTHTHRVIAPPATIQQPSYYQPNRPIYQYNYTGSSNFGQYPNVPATDLQPPYYEPTNRNNYYPSVPASELQPPYYSPHPQVPATDLQPPYYEGPSSSLPNITGSSNTNAQYPNVPSPNLQPPNFDPSDSQRGFSNSFFKPETTAEKPGTLATDLLPPYFDTSTSVYTTTTMASRSKIDKKPEKHNEAPVKKKKVLQSPKQKGHPSTPKTVDPNVPTVSIEYEGSSREADVEVYSGEVHDMIEPDLDVDVLDNNKQVWKPVLVYENKTQVTTTTESSVIMKINQKSADVDLFNIEAPPFQQEEPSFPVYYIAPVQPLSHSKKILPPTPISGQVIRLRGGSGPNDGYVEVQGASPGWGIVCDARNSWTLKEAHVVCKQLGYIRGAEMAWQGRNTREGVPNWIAANTVTCYGNETRFQSCKFSHHQECRVERDAIGVRCVPNRVAQCRKDEIPHDGQCYHLAGPETGMNHADALQYCTQRDARLIDITTQLENDFISEWLLQKHPEVGSVMTSGVGFTTFNRTIWLWEDSSRAKFRFAKWWPGWKGDKKDPPVVVSRHPVCIVMKRKFPCQDQQDSACIADYFFWDIEDCAASMKGHSYVCKRPYDDIGCVYGKGSQYVGTANVTASGKPCLPWADPRVAHPLVVHVVNRDMRQKLKAHNYCRNPNPNKESRPWCFTGPKSEREYCDIPPCGNIDGNIGSKKALLTGLCKPKHFECLPGECIPSPWVCDGEEDCTNGADERSCKSHLNLFQKSARHRLDGYDVEKWLNTPLKTCALRCKEADFTCRSFSHKASENVCLLSDSNIGMTGSLKSDKEFDYYEMKERSVDCDGMFVCGNRKCINQTQVCNGKNDCNDRSDESICTVENLDYAIRLAGSNDSHEGRIEVKILGVWGQVCDDGFGMIDAEVICKELGFNLGALEVRPGGFYGNLDPPTRFMVDQLKCRGNETSLRECDFDGWGVHNCQPEEAVGVVCKTAVDSCQEGHWKCDDSPLCIPTPFICDEVVDCPDGSDESPSHCDAPFEIRLANGSSSLQGRVEVRHHGVWGTVCDDDFSNATAVVICRSLGYGGVAVAKKDGYFGPGEGPIWLDEVFCHGNETQLYRCEHNHWGQHNCDHNEDAGVICSPGDVNSPEVNHNTHYRRRT